MSTLEGLTQDELNKVNTMFEVFGEKTRNLFKSRLITGYTYGYQGDGLFLITMMLDEMNRPDVESRILQQ